MDRAPGERAYHERYDREIILDSSTLEDSLNQYDSMIKEKTMADPCRDDPGWLQILRSTELGPWKRSSPVMPTDCHDESEYGRIESGLKDQK